MILACANKRGFSVLKSVLRKSRRSKRPKEGAEAPLGLVPGAGLEPTNGWSAELFAICAAIKADVEQIRAEGHAPGIGRKPRPVFVPSVAQKRPAIGRRGERAIPILDAGDED